VKREGNAYVLLIVSNTTTERRRWKLIREIGLIVAEKFYDRLGARLNVKLLVNGVEMGANGAEGNAEMVGDFLVQVTFGEESENFLFAFGEFFDVGPGLLDFLEVVNNLAGDLHGHGCSAGMDLLDRLDEFGGRHVFKKVTAGAASQGVENEVAFLVSGEHEDLDFREAFFEAGNTFDAAHSREVDVHEDHIGFFGGDVAERLFAGGMCADTTQCGGSAK
jgi:hypothetical protein